MGVGPRPSKLGVVCSLAQQKREVRRGRGSKAGGEEGNGRHRKSQCKRGGVGDEGLTERSVEGVRGGWGGSLLGRVLQRTSAGGEHGRGTEGREDMKERASRGFTPRGER